MQNIPTAQNPKPGTLRETLPQAAFPLTCLSAVLATLSACLTHSELLASASAGPYLATLEGFACRGFYGDFVFFTTGAPCTSDNVLLNIWCAESGAAVLALLLYTFFQVGFTSGLDRI